MPAAGAGRARRSSFPLGLVPGIDQYGQVPDVLVAEKRDLATTRRILHPRSGTPAVPD
jgi:hypothetical protein